MYIPCSIIVYNLGSISAVKQVNIIIAIEDGWICLLYTALVYHLVTGCKLP